MIRLWPALIVVIVVMLIPGLTVFDTREFLLSSATALFYLTPITSGLFDIKGIYGYTWTLGLEEYFYLLFPLVLLFLIRRKWKISTIAALLSSVSLMMLLTMGAVKWGNPHPYGLFDLFSVAGIGVGCALALIRNNCPSMRHPGFAGVAGIVLLVSALFLASPSDVSGLSFLVADLGTVCIILSVTAVKTSWLARLLGITPLVFLGIISYEIYLWHGILLGVIQFTWSLTTPTAAAITYPIVFLLAYLTHKWLTPLQKLLRSRLLPDKGAS